MSEALREWLDRELKDFEPVWRSFRGKQQRMYYIWMVAAVVGMVALGFGVGYDLAYVLQVHLRSSGLRKGGFSQYDGGQFSCPAVDRSGFLALFSGHLPYLPGIGYGRALGRGGKNSASL